MISALGSANKKKKNDLFRSNIEPQNNSSSGGGITGLFYGLNQNVQLSHKDYLNESIISSSHDDESVAEERESLATVHKTSINTNQTNS